MKKIVIAILTALAFVSCGVGNYSVSSGRADECAVSFTSATPANIEVWIDGQVYRVKSVRDKAYKTDRKIKETVQNTIILTPGTHNVSVNADGRTVYSKKLFISASEHRIIEL